MAYFESHAHYDDKRFDDDRDELLSILPSYGIDFIVNSGSDLKSSVFGLELAAKYDYIYASVGVHPHEVGNMSDETIEQLQKLSENKKAVAIGEIGLDYYYDTYPREEQRKWFKKQLNLAKKVNKPVIIHSRDASQECFDIIKESGVNKGVIHCYSGSADMALEYIKMGYFIGIGGVITFNNSKKLVDVAKVVPIENILIETDSPYLTPVPNRGKRNDSRNLKYIVEKLAKIKGLEVNYILDVTKNNAKKLFF